MNKFLPTRIKKILSRRSFPITNNFIDTFPFREICRLLLGNRLSCFKLFEQSFSINNIYRTFDKFVSEQLPLKDFTHIHCYEDCALNTFKQSKELGIFCSYELPIAYWRTLHLLLKDQLSLRPEWGPTMQYTYDDEEKLQCKDLELELADSIVVPSEFVKNSLKEHNIKYKHIVVAPFGTPVLPAVSLITKPILPPIRFLFAGSMSQRKGLADLLEAFNQLQRSDVELVIMGTPLMPFEFYRSIYNDFIYEPPRPHNEVLTLMQSCHVLVLPSIVEGRALVQQEAMSQQMALLVTRNAGGEDLVISGQTGFIVPPSDPLALVAAINKFADNPRQTLDMGHAARKHVEKYSWDSYCKKIVDSFESES